MTRAFRFGLQAMGPARLDRDVIQTDAREAEALGYHEYWTSDHFGISDPLVPLITAADATTSLRLGPLVLNNEFHHPALLARTAATIDRLTGGRLVLGLGTGYAVAEHEAIGQPIRPPGERVTRLEESVIALRSLLDEGSAELDGEHVQLAIEDLGVRPIQHRVPILLGGHGKRVVSIGARHADIFQFTGLTRGAGGMPEAGGFSVDHIAERARWLEAAADDRNPEIERSSLVQFTYIGDDSDKVLAAQAAEFELDPAIMAETPFVLIGSLEQVVDKCERLREQLGISHFVIRDAAGFAPIVEALTN